MSESSQTKYKPLPEFALPFGNIPSENFSENTLMSRYKPVLHPEFPAIPYGFSFEQMSAPLSEGQTFLPSAIPERFHHFASKARSNTSALHQKIKRIPGYSKSARSLFEQARCMADSLPDPISDLWNFSWKIGLKDRSPKSSSTNKAYAFSEADNILSTELGDEGSERGAFRHILWQSDIVSLYDSRRAKIIGDCHEKGLPFHPEQILFDSLSDADSAVDQFNNIIGREIGELYKQSSTKERALKALDYMHDNGYYRAIRTENGYIVQRVRMTEDTYDRMYDEILNRRDENGKRK